MKVYLLLLAGLLPGILARAQSPVRYTVSGYVREAGSQEALIGVNVYLPGTTIGTTTNTYGFYSLTLPARDSLPLAFSFVGYEPVSLTVPFRKNTERNVLLTPGRTLSEVVVNGARSGEKVSESAQMSQIDLPVAQIRKVPALFGEKDVLKVLQLMPGVQKGSEGNAGIYVRGGGPDQNLIILDDAVVYNANHLFGFFSVFNGDALKSVELIKGGFPARYGGRLSSVIEMNMKEGNKERLRGEGGGGLIASRLTLEGPLRWRKDQPVRSSFLLSGRRTYIDLLTRPIAAIASKGQASGGYSFYDLNAKLNYELGARDRLYLSGYFGRDGFSARDRDDTYSTRAGLNWGNATATLRWNHQFSERLFANTSLIFSQYRFGISTEERSRNNRTGVDETFSLRYQSGIRDLSLKADFDYYPSPAHSVRFGLQTMAHRFTPSAIVLRESQTDRFRREVEAIQVLESGLYAEDTWKPTDRLRINGGLRLSHFHHRNTQYFRPEPRLSASYRFAPDLSFKASYAQMNQYVHLLSNTGIGLPTDLWVPTTDRIRPQRSEQIAAGFAKDFSSSGWTLTLEGYHKTMQNIINYREGASFLLLADPESASEVRWEDNVTSGRGWSSGAELLLQKKTGRFSGWLGYTLSWTRWQFAELNGGKPFFPRYDRRHDLSLVGIYEFSPRFTLSATWVYGTGNALTLPQAEFTAYPHQAARPYQFFGSRPNNSLIQFFEFGRSAQEYGEKNSFRAEPYHRLDVSFQFHRKKKYHERTWELSFYNAYSRMNPFFYTLYTKDGSSPTDPQQTVLRRYSVFPILPSLSYNFKF